MEPRPEASIQIRAEADPCTTRWLVFARSVTRRFLTTGDPTESRLWAYAHLILAEPVAYKEASLSAVWKLTGPFTSDRLSMTQRDLLAEVVLGPGCP
jgi:hypothetical protein